MKTNERVLQEIALDEIHFDGESKATWTAEPKDLFGSQNVKVLTRKEFEDLLNAIRDGEWAKKIRQIWKGPTLLGDPPKLLDGKGNVIQTAKTEKVAFSPNNGVWLLAWQIADEDLGKALKGVNMPVRDAARCSSMSDLVWWYQKSK